MRKIVFLLTIFAMALLGSCEMLPFDYSRSRSWFTQNARNGERAALVLAAVKVDRSGNRDSVEKEFAALAPLYFWEQGCTVVPDEAGAAYIAEIQAREREYSAGWRTRRSLSVEVRLWKRPSDGGPLDMSGIPLAAGRNIAVGERSFASSDTAGRMLSKAIKQAVKKLPLVKKGK